ncbi:myoneurin-like isoform X1 [Aedes albopictus]|uniref:C2H2-type domain-containing protein n=1 Tax=Aedes albopictus TaxID=7160 RepID=A0ABM1YWM2_AEDAL|nr:myoneurin-like isoform X1 [Aedes albopictus]
MTTVNPSASREATTGTGGKTLKPIKTRMRFKKDDVRQCRLCLRMLPRDGFRLTGEQSDDGRSDFRRRIDDAVGVKIVDQDRVRSVCSGCALLVDMISEFRGTCRKAETIHRGRLLMMHPGSWASEENKKTLEDCRNLVKRNAAEMDVLFKYYEQKNVETQQRLERKAKQQSANGPQIGRLPRTLFNEDDDLDMTLLQPTAAPNPSLGSAVQSNRGAEKGLALCDICGKIMEPYNMQYHMNKHTGDRPFACEQEGCGQRFFNFKVLQYHIQRVHCESMLECSVCQRKVKGKLQLKMHMLVHQDSRLPNNRKTACKVCGKLFYKGYIKDHMAVHTGKLAHACEFCGRRFAASNNLCTHRKKAHPDAKPISSKTFQQQQQQSDSSNDG